MEKRWKWKIFASGFSQTWGQYVAGTRGHYHETRNNGFKVIYTPQITVYWDVTYSGVCYNERCYNERMLQRTNATTNDAITNECYNERMLQRKNATTNEWYNERMLQRTNATTNAEEYYRQT